MKKIVYILIIILIVTFQAGCSQENEGQSLHRSIRVASLKGPTSIGLVKLMDQDEKGESKNDYDFLITATADEIVAQIGKGELDIGTIPANLASVLYNKTQGKISVAAINTLGVLYIVENGDSLTTLEDLKGKTIYSTGKGTTPEHVLNYILKSNGLEPGEDVTVEYKTEATELATLLASKEDIIALLPQPFIAASQAKNENISVIFSMEEEWQKLQKESSLVTGVVIVSNEFLEENKAVFDVFLEEYSESVDYVNGNVEEAAKLVGNLGIVPAPIAIKAIPLCNIVLIKGNQMEEKLDGYLEVLFDADPKSVGGQMPDEGFYYKK